jgi:hypothetical protein
MISFLGAVVMTSIFDFFVLNLKEPFLASSTHYTVRNYMELKCALLCIYKRELLLGYTLKINVQNINLRSCLYHNIQTIQALYEVLKNTK